MDDHVPALQFTQVLVPLTRTEKRPGGQIVQMVSPEDKVSSSTHGKQVDIAVAAIVNEYVPKLQDVHEEAVPTE